MNLKCKQAQELTLDGYWGVVRECCSYPKSFAFHVTLYAVLSDSSFFGVLWIGCCGGGFPWQLLLTHIWQLMKWLPKPRGPHRAWVLLTLLVLPEMWRNTGWRAWWLCRVDEVWFAVAEFLGVTSGLLHRLAGLLTLYTGNSFCPPCGGGKCRNEGHI